MLSKISDCCGKVELLLDSITIRFITSKIVKEIKLKRTAYPDCIEHTKGNVHINHSSEAGKTLLALQ
jgi:hypothetical protein